jgi:hypothetical protein
MVIKSAKSQVVINNRILESIIEDILSTIDLQNPKIGKIGNSPSS